jgi:methionyl aminopeptidase
MFTDNADLKKLTKSSKILNNILGKLRNAILNGERDLYELDLYASKLLKDFNSKSAFKDYKPDFANISYPFHICASVNDEIVHGLPSKDKVLQEGDIVTIDLGLEHDGWFSDSAFTIGIGNITSNNSNLIKSCESAFEAAINECKVGNTIGDIGYAIQDSVLNDGFSVVFSLYGHGIGKQLHEEPNIYNFGTRGAGYKLHEGLSFCIEPIIADGCYEFYEKDDQWTLLTTNSKNSSHYEHTIALTKDGPLILTRD